MKARRCLEDKCNMFALNIGTNKLYKKYAGVYRTKCKVHFYKARNKTK